MVLQEGTTNGTMDSKGRFQLPAAILREIPAEDEGRFVVNRSFEKCLTLYPIRYWTNYKAKLSQLNNYDPDMRRAIRYFTGSAAEVKLDSKNRLLIPQTLKEYACLEKDLLISPMDEYIEIWNPRLYDEDMDDFGKTGKETIKELAKNLKDLKNGKSADDIS